MRGAGTSSPLHSCRRRWPSWSAAPCASNLGGSCRPSNSLGTSGLACLLPISPFSGLWHSVAAWGWGRRWRRCPVQVGSVASGVSCLLAVEYLGPPLGPGDIRCAGPRPRHREPARGPRADTACLLGPPKQNPQRIFTLALLWGPGVRGHSVGHRSSNAGDGPSFLVLAARRLPGPLGSGLP